MPKNAVLSTMSAATTKTKISTATFKFIYAFTIRIERNRLKFRYSYDIIVIDMPNDNPETKSATDKLGEGKILPLVFKLTIPAGIAPALKIF